MKKNHFNRMLPIVVAIMFSFVSIDAFSQTATQISSCASSTRTKITNKYKTNALWSKIKWVSTTNNYRIMSKPEFDDSAIKTFCNTVNTWGKGEFEKCLVNMGVPTGQCNGCPDRTGGLGNDTSGK